MSHQYQNSSGQRQPDLKHDHYVVNTNQRQRVWLLWQLLRYNKQVYTNSQKNRRAQSNALATFRWYEEAHEDKHTDDHAGHDGEKHEKHGSASDEEGHLNPTEISTSFNVVFGLDRDAPQGPVTVGRGEFEL